MTDSQLAWPNQVGSTRLPPAASDCETLRVEKSQIIREWLLRRCLN